jgi:hypothetical protein
MTAVAMMMTMATMIRARIEAHPEALLQTVRLQVLRLRARAMKREIQRQQRW